MSMSLSMRLMQHLFAEIFAAISFGYFRERAAGHRISFYRATACRPRSSMPRSKVGFVANFCRVSFPSRAAVILIHVDFSCYRYLSPLLPVGDVAGDGLSASQTAICRPQKQVVPALDGRPI